MVCSGLYKYPKRFYRQDFTFIKNNKVCTSYGCKWNQNKFMLTIQIFKNIFYFFCNAIDMCTWSFLLVLVNLFCVLDESILTAFLLI